jgi:hypothetical protein
MSDGLRNKYEHIGGKNPMPTKKSTKTISLVLLSLILIMLNNKIPANPEALSMQPILDEKADSTLHLQNCEAQKDSTLDWDAFKRYIAIKEPYAKKIKSKKMTTLIEDWSGDGKIVRIERYYFEYPQDALLFPETNFLTDVSGFPGWSTIADIGDKTCWVAPFDVIFIKKNIVVRVFVNPFTLGKEYTLKLAKHIEKKL